MSLYGGRPLTSVGGGGEGGMKLSLLIKFVLSRLAGAVLLKSAVLLCILSASELFTGNGGRPLSSFIELLK
jgi:hypothetical protein